MDRSKAVKWFLSNIGDNDIIIASTGYISREVFKQKDRPLNFYMMGSMGCALSIGIGVALLKNAPVRVIQGDGSALMGLGSMVTAQKLDLPNLYNVILDNGIHESTGGQVTASSHVDFNSIYKRTVRRYIDPSDDIPPRITLSPYEIMKRFKNALRNIDDKI